MLSVIHGVDFSGAARPGKTMWIATLEPTAADIPLRLTALYPLSRLCKKPERCDVLAALVARITASESALWALGFPFAFPVEVMADGCRWAQQFDFIAEWGDQAYAAGVECYRRGLVLGGKGHIRRLTDVEEKTPFDAYHYRVIYQTFYGMRDVLGPLRALPRTAILPFQARRLPNATRVVVEACPSSTLKRLGLPYHNYKQANGGRLTRLRRRTRHTILEGLATKVEMTSTDRLRVMRDGGGDALDAVLAGVGAWRCWNEYDHAKIARHKRYSREGRHYA